MLKGMNFLEGATTRERNGQIGGHRAGEDGPLTSSASSTSSKSTEDEMLDQPEEGDWYG